MGQTFVEDRTFPWTDAAANAVSVLLGVSLSRVLRQVTERNPLGLAWTTIWNECGTSVREAGRGGVIGPETVKADTTHQAPNVPRTAAATLGGMG